VRIFWLATVLLSIACQRQSPPAQAQDIPANAPAASAEQQPRPVATSGSRGGRVAADFQNVRFHIGPGIVMHVARLQGALEPTRKGGIPSFDDLGSYTLAIDSGEVSMTPESLTRVLNDQVFNYEGSPISDVEVSIEEGRLKQKGTLHKGVAVPFTIVADVAVTPDGRIRLHPDSIKAAGMPAGGLMKVFHLELENLIKSNRARGFEIDDNDFVLMPDRLIAEPRISGRLTKIRVEPDRIVEVFGAEPAHRPDRIARNYMYYRGGMLRFGKLTMTDTDLRLIDEDPRDPFEFSPADYLKQLVAGYSKSQPNGGLRTFMPDLDEVGRAERGPK
jgi:hypothetical protein